MHEYSKALELQFSRFGSAQPLVEVDSVPTEATPSPNRIAMEHFGKAIGQLLDCRSCYVAMMPRATGSELEALRIGDVTSVPPCTTTVARIVRKGAGDCTLLEPVNGRTAFVRKLIGSEPGTKSHSVIGRFASREKATVLFVAGWRAAKLSAAEIPCLVRAVPTMWEMANALAQQTRAQSPDSRVWLEELAFPAFISDASLRIYDANRGARDLLAKRELLKVDAARLSGSNAAITEHLQEAIREASMPRAGRALINTTVPLSTERQQFAFAQIARLPMQGTADLVLIIVPQFNEVVGAHRIAAAFGLNWAEERIIARILQFQSPRDIGTDLGLTEATVRTYTKRIMLKLGINRQSEFFLLYHLTQSPFSAARREKAATQPMRFSLER